MNALPSETVTFLFTDIESSTKLWGHNPETMRAALRRHDEIVREAIERNGGAVFKTVGDAFYAAFARPIGALKAAVDAQLVLGAEPWPEDSVIVARMAVHTGVAELRDGDYYGSPLNRLARLLSAGSGGQILLSRATHELVVDHLPDGIGIRDLDEHCLKDLLHPEHIYQLLVPGLNNDFPPLQTLTSHPNNLPIQMTQFIGRQAEVREVCALIRRDHVRVVTLHGPGGTGKTRLALQVAADLLDQFEDGVFLVRLDNVPDASLVPGAIAQTLGVKEANRPTPDRTVQEYLQDKRLLLVLDNFEQVIDAAAFVSTLLQVCPKIEIVITSRVVLRISGEHQYAVPTLVTPDPTRAFRLAELRRLDSVALFLDRAQSVRPDLVLNEENAAAIAEICRQLDGLPLAIELAAARTRLFPPPALLARLKRRLPLLTGGARDLPPRQQTLRGAIDWSHSLLAPEEQTLFARLAVFAGGFTLGAVEAVCNADQDLAIDVIDGVGSLVDKSLLRDLPTRGEEPRFGMLHTIREYALERLRVTGHADDFLRRHAAHFRALAEEAEPGLRAPHPDPWLNQLEEEYDNLRAALDWSQGHDAVLFLCLAARLWRYWFSRNRLSEGRRWLAAALATDANDPLHRAEALRGAGDIAQTQGDYDEGAHLLEQSVTLYREIADRPGLAGALSSLGWIHADQGDYERAVALHTESLTIYRELEDRWGIATSLDSLAWAAIFQRDRIRSVTLHNESLAIAREIGDKWTEANALTGLGWAATLEGKYDEALRLQTESLALRRSLGVNLVVAYGLEGIAALAAAGGERGRGCRLWGAAEAVREKLGAPLTPFDLALYRGLRPAEGERDEASWAEGRAMSLDQAIDYALEEPAGQPTAVGG